MGPKPEISMLVSQQRRIRGVISSMAPGACEIDSMHGTFLFDVRSVKPNKNHPNRMPSVGDPCEFRLGHTVPTPAVSIRVAVPKVRKATQSLEDDNPSVVHMKRVFEASCGHVSPLVMKLTHVPLRRAVTVLHLLSYAMDVVEVTKLVPLPMRQSILADFMRYFHNPASLPIELTHSTEHSELFASFEHVMAVFLSLSDTNRMVVHSTLVKRAELLSEHLTAPIVSLADNTAYLRVVGGLVGEGVAKLVDVYLTGRFNPSKPKSTVGLFAEKVEAVRTFLEFDGDAEGEDIVTRGDRFPQSVWGCHLDLFGQIASGGSRRRAVEAVNVLLVDAFEHAASAVDLLAMVVDHADIFCMLAVPCLMALNHIATLYGNVDQFSPVLPTQSISPKHAGDILGIEHPTQSTWFFTKALDDFEERVLQYVGSVPPELASSILSTRSSVRRLDTTVTVHAQQVKPENRSLTRALLAEQGAALGGKLLYSMIDSLGTVFHQPYAQHPSDYQSSYGDLPDNISMFSYEESELGGASVRSEHNWRGGGGALDYLTGVARSWLGYNSYNEAPHGYYPRATPSTASVGDDRTSFAGFYEGGDFGYPDDDETPQESAANDTPADTDTEHSIPQSSPSGAQSSPTGAQSSPSGMQGRPRSTSQGSRYPMSDPRAAFRSKTP